MNITILPAVHLVGLGAVAKDVYLSKSRIICIVSIWSHTCRCSYFLLFGYILRFYDILCDSDTEDCFRTKEGNRREITLI